ncbi:MAG: late competence development ComFB family protein [Candidatus Omnitrophica bacterium]|nr:late competence development ComFB family protein [Candidatus Omnitrophota bacterium]
MKACNIMEDITKKYLDEMLSMRFDICTCDICKQDIIAFALTRIPPKYVTAESAFMDTLIEQARTENSQLILKELVMAIRTITANPKHEEGQDRDKAYHLLMKQIKDDRGVDFSHYRDRVLKRRIALRMRARNVQTYSEYLQVLIHSPEEYEDLFDVLTINVSAFFRDKVVWDKLKRDVFPALIAKKLKEHGLRRIRVWSAGCSHGEEPYSLAIMLYELTEKMPEKIKIEIYGSDIDRECLKQAMLGQYDSESVKGLSAYQLRRFFIPVGDKYQIVPHVKELVQFKKRNLIHDPAFPGVDMVTCRNVFIYFNRSLQEHLIMKYHGALNDEGYFVMGTSENLLGEARQVFSGVDSSYRIYQKIPMKRY